MEKNAGTPECGNGGTPCPGPPLRWTSSTALPKISRFFPLSIFAFFFFSLWGSSRVFFALSGGLLVELWWCLKHRDPQMCTFGLSGCRVQPRRPGPPPLWSPTRERQNAGMYLIQTLAALTTRFSTISSNFLGPAKNSRLMSSGIISLTAKIFCASSIALNGCSCSATFNHHAVSLSFSSFATLHFFWASQVWSVALLLGRATTWAQIRRPVLAMPRTRDSVLFE